MRIKLLLGAFYALISLSGLAQTDSMVVSPRVFIGCDNSLTINHTFEFPVSSYSFSVYDRWGALMNLVTIQDSVPQREITFVWDAKQAPVGTYTYVVDGFYVGGMGFRYMGMTELIR